MTSKEAIYFLKRMEEDAERYGRISLVGRHTEIAKAIEALEMIDKLTKLMEALDRIDRIERCLNWRDEDDK